MSRGRSCHGHQLPRTGQGSTFTSRFGPGNKRHATFDPLRSIHALIFDGFDHSVFRIRSAAESTSFARRNAEHHPANTTSPHQNASRTRDPCRDDRISSPLDRISTPLSGNPSLRLSGRVTSPKVMRKCHSSTFSHHPGPFAAAGARDTTNPATRRASAAKPVGPASRGAAADHPGRSDGGSSASASAQRTATTARTCGQGRCALRGPPPTNRPKTTGQSLRRAGRTCIRSSSRLGHDGGATHHPTPPAAALS